MRFLRISCWSLLASCMPAPGSPEIFFDEIIPGQLAVVYSYSNEGDRVNTTSNIFLIKGINDTVWIFGTGYGNGNLDCADCNDYTYYRGRDFSVTHSALFDARQVQLVVDSLFHLSKERAMVQCLAPHFHADHLNAEFISALFDSLGYQTPSSPYIRVHIADSTGAVCNAPCCGTEPCPDKHNPYYAAPYQPVWTETQLQSFQMLGNLSDTCNQVVFQFQSASGKWEVCKAMSKADGGHTDGTINLHNDQHQIRLSGTLNKPACPLPGKNWVSYPVHGLLSKK